MAGSSNPQIVRFGAFEVDLSDGSLHKNGVRIRVQGKPLQILILLVEHAGDVVTRDDLRQRLWPEGTFVDFEHGLNTAVRKLREALGDHPDNPRFVQTVPRQGYRFIAPAQLAGPAGPPQPALQTRRTSRLRILAATALIIAIAALIAVALGVSGRWSRTGGPGAMGSPLVAIPFTALHGAEDYPAFSPDGNQIAYTWTGDEGSSQGIYVKLIGPATVLRLTAPATGEDSYPVWSPDGHYVAFYRKAPGLSGYYVVSALGGPERLIAGMEVGECVGLDWSPDGKRLVVAQGGQQAKAAPLLTVDVDTGAVQTLNAPPGGTWGDASPAFSPDGKKLAFVRWFAAESADVYVMPWPAGPERRLTSDGVRVWGISWLADSREIVFPSPRGGGPIRLWRLSINGGMRQPITSGGQDVYRPSVARQGSRLAYVADAGNNNIWRMALTGSAPAGGETTRLISSTRYQQDPQYSPDGARIAYSSDRSGSNEIWVSDADGRASVQLTHFGGPAVGSARWSPDGQRLAFDTRVQGNPDIFVVRADGGAPNRVTTNAAEDVVPSWSHDGHWIYFASNRSGDFQIWKVRAETGETSSSPAVKVTHQGGFNAFESADAHFLYFNRSRGKPALLRLSLPDGREEPVLDSLQDWGWWATAPQGIFFLNMGGSESDSRLRLMFFDPVARRTQEVAKMHKPVTQGNAVLTASPDGRYLAYTQIDQDGSDVMLIENFR
jgi:Tol biopolymer transport system component/DNA-binding winged helix-turn-helix (wHTH) protein